MCITNQSKVKFQKKLSPHLRSSITMRAAASEDGALEAASTKAKRTKLLLEGKARSLRTGFNPAYKVSFNSRSGQEYSRNNDEGLLTVPHIKL